MKELIVLAKNEEQGQALFEGTKAAAEQLKIAYSLRMETNATEIMMHGVTLTPALVIDDAVRVMGRVPEHDELVSIIDMVQ